MTNELATIEQTALTPAEFAQELEDARLKAKSLTEIVEDQKLFTMISGKKHLRVEAWQTIGMGYGLSVAVKDTEIIYNSLREELGAKAGVVVYNKHGVVVGGAEAYCMCNEADWGNRNTNQRISMAGTRATSKALRLLLSWVVVLAGYEPTPAEEMARDIKEDLGACEQHGVAYFKTGNMRSPAHKKDDGSWCNAPTEPRQRAKKAKKATESAPVTPQTMQGKDPADEGQDGGLEELRETLEHYCLEHQSPRRQGSVSGRWVHLIDGDSEQPCFEEESHDDTN